MFRRKTVRYRSRAESETLSLELSFRGATEVGEANPRRTGAVLTASRKIDCAAGWVDLWSIRCGDPEMPAGPWHGFQLAAIVGGRLFAALGNELVRLSEDTGEFVWRVTTGNTHIQQIVVAAEGELLVVRSASYRFVHPSGRSNLCAFSLDGEPVWRAAAPAKDDAFANWVRRSGGLLSTTSWHGLECRISERDGAIVEKEWMK